MKGRTGMRKSGRFVVNHNETIGRKMKKPPPQSEAEAFSTGAPTGTRTPDTLIKSQVL